MSTTTAPRTILIVNAQLSQHGEQKPYFSITGEIWEPVRGNPEKLEEKYGADFKKINGKQYLLGSCGCIHEDIARRQPKYKSLIPLHLSDIDGVPMYAIDNGFYHFKSSGEAVVQKYLRLTDGQMRELRQRMIALGMTKEVFAGFVSEMLPIWKAEAEKAIADFNLQIVKS